MPQPDPKQVNDAWPIFRRLLRMLRPWYGQIAIGVVLLLLNTPCELFPAIVWMHVADDIVLAHHSTGLLHRWFSLNGRITDPYWLVISAASWMFIVYLLGEFFGTLETNLLNRIAQKFIQ